MNNATFEEHNCLIFPPEFHANFDFYSKNIQLTTSKISIICGILSPFIVCSNILYLRAMIKNPVLHSPPNIILCSLATADLLSGLLCLPLYIGWLSNYKLNQSCYYTTSVVLFCFIVFGGSFFTIIIISLERYIALFYHLRYLSVVTIRRTVRVLIVFWAYSFVNCFISLGLFHIVGLLCAAIANLSIGLTIIAVSYAKITKLVRRHQSQIQAQMQAQPLSLSGSAKQRKMAITMGFVVGVVLGCYLPLCCVYSVIILKGMDEENIEALLFCFVAGLSSSLWNPTIYCWRNREIRTAVISQIREIKALFT